MVLKCLCPWKGNLSMVSWTKTPNRDPIAVFHPEYGVNFSYRYRERIEFLRSTSMDGSISMRNVTHQDIGRYQCSIQTFPQGSWSLDVQVEDLGEKKWQRRFETIITTPSFPPLISLTSSFLLFFCRRAPGRRPQHRAPHPEGDGGQHGAASKAGRQPDHRLHSPVPRHLYLCHPGAEAAGPGLGTYWRVQEGGRAGAGGPAGRRVCRQGHAELHRRPGCESVADQRGGARRRFIPM